MTDPPLQSDVDPAALITALGTVVTVTWRLLLVLVAQLVVISQVYNPAVLVVMDGVVTPTRVPSLFH